MKWSPFLSAVSAVVYIGVVVLFMGFIDSTRHETPDTLLDGMGFLLLFVLSAAVMAFLFFYHPVSMLLENKKREAVSFFLQTLGIFGVITTVVLVLVGLQ